MFPGSGGANEVKILLTAVDKASPAFDKVQAELKQTEKQTGGMGGAFKAAHTNMLGMVAAGTAVLGTAVGIGMAIKRTADEYVNWAMEVRNMSTILGSSYEETSRLIDLANDYTISTQQLEAALKAAIRKGYEPTIANLGKMSDEYLELQPGIERTKYLMDTFGRSGADLARIMELGSAKIEEFGHSIDGTAKEMTEEGMKAAEEYRLKLVEWGDAVENIKLQAGKSLIDFGLETLSFMERLDIAGEDTVGLAEDMKDFNIENEKTIEGMWRLKIAFLSGAIAEEEYRHQVALLKGEYESASPMYMAFMDQVRKLPPLLRETGLAAHEAAGDLKYAGLGLDEIAQSAPYVETSLRGIISALDPGIGNAIDRALDQIEFFEAGGQEITNAYKAAFDAIDKTGEPTDALTSTLVDAEIAAEALRVKSGEITFDEAAANLDRNLDTPVDELKTKLQTFIDMSNQEFKTYWRIIVEYVIPGTLPPGGGGHPFTPPKNPKNPKKPLPPEEIGGNNPIPGGGMNINEINVFGGGDPGAIANQVVNQLNLLQRGAYRAGIEYTGR